MIDLLHSKLRTVERDLNHEIQAPTFPIIEAFNLPQDAVEAQICLDDNANLCYYLNATWYEIVGSFSLPGILPQDLVEGQIAIGLDNSLNWYGRVNFSGTPIWQSVVGVPFYGGPQDVVNGQLALSSDRPVWFSEDSWWGPLDPGFAL